MKICADAGGTNIRFALVDDEHKVKLKKKYPAGQFISDGAISGFTLALNHFIEENLQAAPTSALFSLSNINDLVVSAAGPVDGDRVQFRNANWIIKTEQVMEQFRDKFAKNFRVCLLNDFEALAYGLSMVGKSDTMPIFSRDGIGDTMIVCGPGTGLGLAALKKVGNGLNDLSVIPSEGGHQSFPAETHPDQKLCEDVFGNKVSYEQILSGQGLQQLYTHFCEGRPNIQQQSPEEIVNLYLSGNVSARRALEFFSSALGTFCGNMVLAFGARKGVYLWGGILKSFPHGILRTKMMARFHDRGRANSYVENVPVYKIISDEVALRGCSIYSEKVLNSERA